MAHTTEQQAEAERIGARLRWAREALGLTRAQLSVRIGCRPWMVGAMESGNRVPSVFLAMSICHSLGISPQYLLWGILQECERELTARLSRAHPELRLPGEEVKHSEMPRPGKRGSVQQSAISL
jgi:transcriptional regulator with XRE-family HTH domain